MGGEEKEGRTAKVALKILKGEAGVFLVEMRIPEGRKSMCKVSDIGR